MIVKTKDSRAKNRQVTTALYFWVMLTSMMALSGQAAGSCLSSVGKAAIDPCRREILQDPGNADLRIVLSDALISLKQYQEAVEVLRQGFEHSPGNERLKKKLALTESYLDEQQWIKKQEASAASASKSKKQETQIRLSLIRCRKLNGDAALSACNQGLKLAPNHPDLLTGRGEAWLAMGNPGRAMADFNAALNTDPDHRDAAKNLRLARTKRKIIMNRCLKNDGLEALTACDAVLVKGASDSFDIQKRRAALLTAAGKKKDAIAAYQAALQIKPSDAQSKKALAALTPPKKVEKRQPKAIAKIEPPPINKPEKKPAKKSTKKSIDQPVKKVSPVVEKPAPTKKTPKMVLTKKTIDPPKTTAKKTIAQVAVSSDKKAAVTDKPASAPEPQPSIKQPNRFSNLPEVAGVTH